MTAVLIQVCIMQASWESALQHSKSARRGQIEQKEKKSIDQLNSSHRTSFSTETYNFRGRKLRQW